MSIGVKLACWFMALFVGVLVEFKAYGPASALSLYSIFRFVDFTARTVQDEAKNKENS